MGYLVGLGLRSRRQQDTPVARRLRYLFEALEPGSIGGSAVGFVLGWFQGLGSRHLLA